MVSADAIVVPSILLAFFFSKIDRLSRGVTYIYIYTVTC